MILVGMRQCRGIHASPATDVAMRVDTIVAGQETGVELAGAQGGGDGLFLDGKSAQGQESINLLG